jgi:hypothetical protein
MSDSGLVKSHDIAREKELDRSDVLAGTFLLAIVV